MCFGEGVRQAGWLWKRFGHGHTSVWKRLWFQLAEDRLCYVDPEGDPGTTRPASHAPPGPGGAGPTGPRGSWGGGRAAAAGLRSSSGGGGGGGGCVRYLPLDRIPVRPLPHRQHALDPRGRGHPDIGVAIIDARILTGGAAEGAGRSVLSVVVGSHTHYLAAETLRDAQRWAAALREAWLHCFQHTARGGGGGGAVAAGAALAAENAALRESLREAGLRRSAEDGEYWRRWVEERARNELLASQLESLVGYEVAVVTGGAKGAGTSARVYIEAWGRGGREGRGSGEARLLDADSPAAPFERGATDEFEVLLRDVGAPVLLRVWHDNTGRHPEWLLERIALRKKGTAEWTHFPCGRWLSTERDDGRICRELWAADASALRQVARTAYCVATFTSDRRGAGTDANVHITLHGGASDVFEVSEAADLGPELVAVTVGHDGGGDSPAWHLDRIEVTRLPGGPTTLFPCGEWLDAAQGDGATERRLAAAKGPPPKAWYVLAVTTGDLPGAGADGGNAYAALAGSDGRSGREALPCGRGSLARGGRDTFRLHLPMLGELQRLTLGLEHRGGPAPPSWHVAGAEVLEEASGRRWHFTANRWLGSAAEGGCCEVVLPAIPGPAPADRERFTVTFYTGSAKGAGTDAAAWFELWDDGGGSTGPVRAAAPPAAGAAPGAFYRGAVDALQLSLPRLGARLARLAVWHDGSDASSAWQLRQVTVRRGWGDGGGEEPVSFPCRRWLAPPSPRVELLPGAPAPAAAPAHYRLEVATADVRGAGTDASVSVEILGPGRGGGGGGGQGAATAAEAAGLLRSGQHRLDRAGAFERGAGDVFEVSEDEVELGLPCGLRVTSDGRGPRAAWRLAGITLHVLDGPGGRPVASLCFPADRWLDAASGLVAELSAAPPAAPPRPAVPYTLRVTTSDVRGAGSDAGICVQLVGEGGVCGWQPLPATGDTFGRGQEDVFVLRLPDVGPLRQLRVRSDGAGAAPAWHLDAVAVTAPAAAPGQQESRWWFVARRWLDAGHGLEVTLDAQAAPPDGGAATAPYLVTVVTSDVRGAGTDAGVSIEVWGDAASSGPHALDPGPARPDAFSRGAADVFRLALPRLGALRRLRVSTDERGAAWRLDHIAVAEDAPGGAVWYFPFDTWLGGPGGALTSAEAAASSRDPRAALKTYQVVVRTSDAPGAGTDAEPYLELVGAAGATGGRAPLRLPQPGAFSRGACDALRVACRDVGPELAECVVEVTDPASGVTWFFDARCWLDRARGDGATERRLRASRTDPRSLRAASYQLTVHTSDRPGAGLAPPGAAVTVELRFGRGGCDALALPASRDCGELQLLRIAVSGAASAWHLSHVEVLDPASGRRWLFPCRDWLGAGRAVAARELRALPAGCWELPPEADEPWELLVTTCPAPGSELRGPGAGGGCGGAPPPAVCTRLLGPRGQAAGPFELGPAAAAAAGAERAGAEGLFGCGQSSAFVVDVWLDTAEPPSPGGPAVGGEPSWRLESVRATRLSDGARWWFWCGAWLGGASGQRRVLEALAADPRGGAEDYQVTTCTSALPGTATTAAVFIDIAGAAGSSGAIELRPPAAGAAGGGPFAEGGVSSFALRLAPALGELSTLRVWTDGGGAAAAWHLERVEVAHPRSGKVWHFACGQWLAADPGDGATSRTLAAGPSPHEQKQQQQQGGDQAQQGDDSGAAGRCDYRVEVQTGSDEGAGTDARVFLQIGGERGEAEARQLRARAPEGPRPKRDAAHVRVAKRAAQGGGRGGEGARPLFQRGGLDAFVLRSLADVGRLTHVTVGHDASGHCSAWQLAWLRVTNLATGESALFPGPLWLDPARAGGCGWARLEAGAGGGAPAEAPWSSGAAIPAFWGGDGPERPGPSPRAAEPGAARPKPWLLAAGAARAGACGYKVTFRTSQGLGAGTGSRVFFELIGEGGSSGIVYVGGGRGGACGGGGGGSFERGGVASLLFPRLPHVGPLRQLRVGTDGAGLFAPWHLRRVEVVHVASGDAWLFDAHAWVDRRCGFQRILPPARFEAGREAGGGGGGARGAMLSSGCFLVTS
ncbi:MAG: Lipase/lipooxygenase [Monoraphidium minutum]|nr:MAG: Lipase/lipooxygenase [Monoraphidium minutum]